MINKYLLALACGDSYGSFYEYEGLCGHKFNIKKLPKYPIKPNITDDTIMAKMALEHYMKYKTVIEDELLATYKKWAITSGLDDGIGIHTYNVLVKNVCDKDSQGNGALMRNIPFALQMYEDGYSFHECVKMMNTDSFLTHQNDTIAVTNQLSLDLAINGIGVLSKDEYKDIISKLHYGDTAWVIHSLYIVIEALKQNLNYTKGFKYITSIGGDTDTNCAIFGAIKSFKYDVTKELDISKFVDINSIKLFEI